MPGDWIEWLGRIEAPDFGDALEVALQERIYLELAVPRC
jgi:hypothetical protein